MPNRAPPTIPKVVLFDMDDTIFDHRFAVRQALARVRRDDARLSRSTLAGLLGEYDRLLEAVHPDVLAGRMTHAEARRERFRKLFEWSGARLPERELALVASSYRAFYQAARRPVPGAPELLRWLRRRATVGVVSNNHTDEQNDKLRALGLDGEVDFLLTSEDAGVEKPDPAIFRRALELAGAEAHDAVMVGDNWPADVEGALAAGIRPVWLNPSRRPRPPGRPAVAELLGLRPIREVASRLDPSAEEA
ncbi:MAG: HAD-IA family hydrolase [Thermoplasmata archaeon]|nr:HAD-IA family hydrolase [Thermoplasmata archaeon]